MAAQAPKVDAPALMELMVRLGQAYLACGEQTAIIELFLRRVAVAHRMRRARVVAFPTAIFISLHDGTREHVTLGEGPLRGLRLDQIAEVYTFGADAQKASLDPEAGLERLNAILRQPAQYTMPWQIFGHVLFTVGLALVLMPTAANVSAAAILGAIVGLIKAISKDRPVLDAPLSVVVATLVSALVFLAFKRDLPIDPLPSLVPPLVTFLPGAMLTFGMIELAYGDMVSGTSRLMSGFVQLVLLAFGLAAGAALVGFSPADLVTTGELPDGAAFFGWFGVVVFGLGVCIHRSAPKGALPWVLISLLITFGAQRLAADYFGDVISGFFGMLVATPLGFIIHLRLKGPPSMVTFLPCFWLLVPGALGLESVTRMMSDSALGIQQLVNATFVFASLALGTLVGASLYQWVTEQLKLRNMAAGRAPRKAAPAPKPPAAETSHAPDGSAAPGNDAA